MGTDGGVPEYTRQDLRKATRFSEGDYRGINPREFYRRLKRRLEEVQTADDFKYETVGNQRSDLEIISENVGQKTGRIDGRLLAESEWGLLGTGTLEYKPYGPHGALAIVVGLLVGLFAGMAEEMSYAIVGVLAVVAGLFLYFKTDTGEFPVARKDVIRTLMTGEVSERTIEETDEERTDIFANMSVIYAGDTFVNGYTGRIGPSVNAPQFDELNWVLRRAIVRQVKFWQNDIVVPEQRFDMQGEFVHHLSAWSDRDAEGHRRAIDDIQSDINASFGVRLRYTEELLDQLGAAIRDDVSEQQEEINAELEELAEDMEVYVDREGLEHTA